MPEILLATLNARYSHSALGLRCLLANLGPLRAAAGLMEFTIQDRPLDIAERLLALEPRILGFGVYVWNVREIADTLGLIRQLRPELTIVLGGPEISHETLAQPLARLADYVIAGPAERAFAELCQKLLAGERPSARLIQAVSPPLAELRLPDAEYDDRDLQHRNVYIEAARGCPFGCEFCLSALDRTIAPFPLEQVLAALDRLWARGARQFRFVDRTFNLLPAHSGPILDFFLERPDPRLFVHVEMIPDRLPAALRARIQRFPPGTLQLEIGFQTFDPAVQALIGRRQDPVRALDNLRFLRQETGAHLHTDLIAGLPGEDLASFAAGFDRLIALDPHEIQIGMLKRLRGAPIVRHTETHGMRYQTYPPYQAIATDAMDFATLRRLDRCARYWDLIGNSGRFRTTRPLLLSASTHPGANDGPFMRFLRLSDWLYRATGRTHGLALETLFEQVYHGAQAVLELDAAPLAAALGADYRASGTRRELPVLGALGRPARRAAAQAAGPPARQSRHRSRPE